VLFVTIESHPKKAKGYQGWANGLLLEVAGIA